MKLFIMNLCGISLLFCSNLKAKPSAKNQVLYKTSQPAQAYVDAVDSSRVLIVNIDLGYVFDVDSRSKKATFDSVDESCLESTMVYKHPFLVNPKLTCLLSDDNQSIKVVSKTKPRKNWFSTTYLLEQDGYQYYLFNGREFPQAKSGYVQVKKVRIKDGSSIVGDWLEGVPDFSGALAIDSLNKMFYITVAHPDGKNEAYIRNVYDLYISIDNAVPVTFSSLFDSPAFSFRGLSWRLFVNDTVSFYDNRSDYGDYDSIFIDSDGVSVSVILPESCQSLGFSDARVLLGWCNKQELREISIGSE